MLCAPNLAPTRMSKRHSALCHRTHRAQAGRRTRRTRSCSSRTPQLPRVPAVHCVLAHGPVGLRVGCCCAAALAGVPLAPECSAPPSVPSRGRRCLLSLPLPVIAALLPSVSPRVRDGGCVWRCQPRRTQHIMTRRQSPRDSTSTTLPTKLPTRASSLCSDARSCSSSSLPSMLESPLTLSPTKT